MKITWDTEYVCSALLSQTTESHQGCLSQHAVTPATATPFQFLTHVNLIPISGSSDMLFPLPGMLFQ